MTTPAGAEPVTSKAKLPLVSQRCASICMTGTATASVQRLVCFKMLLVSVRTMVVGSHTSASTVLVPLPNCAGKTLKATFVAPGTATVSGYFDNECSAADMTPCTIPPMSQINLTVTVVGP